MFVTCMLPLNPTVIVGDMSGKDRSEVSILWITHWVLQKSGALALRQQIHCSLLMSGMQATQTIYRSRGLGGFYAGLLPTLLRDVPEIAIQFTLYEK